MRPLVGRILASFPRLVADAFSSHPVETIFRPFSAALGSLLRNRVGGRLRLAGHELPLGVEKGHSAKGSSRNVVVYAEVLLDRADAATGDRFLLQSPRRSGWQLQARRAEDRRIATQCLQRFASGPYQSPQSGSAISQTPTIFAPSEMTAWGRYDPFAKPLRQ